ncbi:hypothetical protein MP638_002066 [Amoeboaphelidium occidentale]|nr:hypothetical protein MP638_002066 [Amoeboaphelidium occidentale]
MNIVIGKANELASVCGHKELEVTHISEMVPLWFLHVHLIVLRHLDLPCRTSDNMTLRKQLQRNLDDLSLDILNIDLDHIKADDILKGDIMALKNLLEVYHSLLMALHNRKSMYSKIDQDFDVKLFKNGKRKGLLKFVDDIPEPKVEKDPRSKLRTLEEAFLKELQAQERKQAHKEQIRQKAAAMNTMSEMKTNIAKTRKAEATSKEQVRSMLLKRQDEEDRLLKQMIKESEKIRKETFRAAQRQRKEEETKQIEVETLKLEAETNYLRDQFELRKEALMKQTLKLEAETNYLRDQFELRKEALKKRKEEYDLRQKAKRDDERQRKRDEKQASRDKIQKAAK